MNDKNFIDDLRRRTRGEWQAYLREQWTSFRIWIQENGELAAAAAFIAGIFIVLAFKIVIVALVFVVLIGAATYYYAPQQNSAEKSFFQGNGNINGQSDSEDRS